MTTWKMLAAGATACAALMLVGNSAHAQSSLRVVLDDTPLVTTTGMVGGARTLTLERDLDDNDAEIVLARGGGGGGRGGGGGMRGGAGGSRGGTAGFRGGAAGFRGGAAGFRGGAVGFRGGAAGFRGGAAGFRSGAAGFRAGNWNGFRGGSWAGNRWVGNRWAGNRWGWNRWGGWRGNWWGGRTWWGGPGWGGWGWPVYSSFGDFSSPSFYYYSAPSIDIEVPYDYYYPSYYYYPDYPASASAPPVMDEDPYAGQQAPPADYGSPTVPAYGTYPYDGGPQYPVPKPRTQPAPQQPRQPAGRPMEGRTVSAPAVATKFAYPAYGEEPVRRTNFAEDRPVLVKTAKTGR
jgi:hypothetical protein